MNRNDVMSMNRAERLQAMELLWESMTSEKDTIELPAWHELILQERIERLKQGNSKFISLVELKNTTTLIRDSSTNATAIFDMLSSLPDDFMNEGRQDNFPQSRESL